MAQRVETFLERYHSMFVWFITMRYIFIGLEYIILDPQTRRFWDFAEVWPQTVGWWMLLTGLCGAASRYACRNCWSKCARVLTGTFAAGVMIHSLFRITLLAQQHALLDPLGILFICDLAAASWLQFQLRKWAYTCIVT
jgi:hypothetical protein